jgi:chromosome segregation ATPase
MLVIVPFANRLATRRLKAGGASQLVKLGRGDAITQLKIDLDALRDKFRATEEDLTVSATAARQAERALVDKESELARLTSTLNERSMQEDVQKTEIVALRMQVEALQGQLARADEEAKAAEERRDVAVRALSEKESELARLATALDERAMREDVQETEIVALRIHVEALQRQLAEAGEAAKAAEERRDVAVCALSEKQSELSILVTALDERSMQENVQRTEIVALRVQVETLQGQLLQAGEAAKAAEERCDVAVGALSEKESDLARLTTALDERSVLVDSQKAEIVALTTQIQTLKERLAQVGEEARAMEERGNAAECALSERELELANLTCALNERSVLVDSQKVENGALRMQVRALNDQLIHVGKEARALEERHDVERNELQAATQNLMEEREKFERLHHHVVNVIQELTAQHGEDRALDRSAREDLENRLVERSRLLDESESELTYLRVEIEIARKAEDDLRIAVIEIDGRANATIQSLNAEKVQLQAALDRANGERTRLVHELADLKRRQADQANAAERVDNAAMPERVKDIAVEGARRSVCGRLPQIADS